MFWGHAACQRWVLIVTLLSQSGGGRSQESLSYSEVCGATLVADIRARAKRQMSGHLLSN